MKRAPRKPKHNAEKLLLAADLSNAEARFLVTNYYESQETRKRCDMQLRHLGDRVTGEHTPYLMTMAEDYADMEKDLAKQLEAFVEASPVGRWILAQYGVGPVIAAGMLAHLDIEKAPTAGHFWSFAGQNPEQKWEKGQKRPYNAVLKQLCYHFGECVKRTSKAADSIYGKIYRERKEFLVKRNEEGYNAERAKTFKTNSSEVRKVLKQGKLPPGNLDRQACNFAAKIFLSHLHAIMYWDKYKKAPPKPFAIAILGHGHEIRIPMTLMFPGFAKAYYGEEEELPQAAE